MKIFNSVSKINNLFLILIVTVYIFILGAATLLVDANPEYKAKESADSVFGENMTPYQKIISTHELSQTSHSSEHYVYSFLNNKYGMKASNAYHKVILESKKGEYVYANVIPGTPTSSTKEVKYSYIGTGKTEISRSIRYHDRLRNIGINSIICKYQWDEANGTNNPFHFEKSYQIDILKLSNEEMIKAVELSSTTASTDLYSLSFKLTERTTSSRVGYVYEYTITPKDVSNSYRLNTQVFAEGKNGELFELCGAYNYYDNTVSNGTGKKLSLFETSSANYISDKIKADNIYIKVEYYTANDVKDTKVFSINYQELIEMYKANK